jgi:hypothetical protein
MRFNFCFRQVIVITNVMLCICSNRGLSPSATHCLISTLANKPTGLDLGYVFLQAALIDRVRSNAATKFLESEGKILIMLDDDIIYNPEYIYQLIEDCLDKKSIVTGPYVKKALPADDLALCPLAGNESFDIGPTGKVQEIKLGATGFMAIHRDVLEAMAAAIPMCNNGTDYELIPMFMPFVKDGDYYGEDFAFCERARQLGFKIWVDTRFVLGHSGSFVYMVGQEMPIKVKQINK